MRRNGAPFAVLLLPDVGVAPARCAAVGRGVGRAAVDDGDVVEHPDRHVHAVETLDCDRLRGLLEEAGPVDDRAIRVAAKKVLREDLIEALYVAILYGIDVVAIERDERVVVVHGKYPRLL